MSGPLTKEELDCTFSPFDLKRLDSYANNMLDYHVIVDLLPTIAHMYFTGRLKGSNSSGDGAANDYTGFKLSGVQTALLLAIGLQRKQLEDVEKELGVQSSQLLAMFVKVVRKTSALFRGVLAGAVEKTLPQEIEPQDDVVDRGGGGEQPAVEDRFAPLAKPLDQELAEGGAEALSAERERARSMIDALPLDRYEIATGETDGWADAERQVERAVRRDGKTAIRVTSTTVSVKSSKPVSAHAKRKAGEAVEEAHREEIAGREGKRGKKVRHGRKG